MAKNSNAYPALHPISPSSLVRSSLRRHIKSPEWHATTKTGSDTIQPLPTTPSAQSEAKPASQSAYCDERLENVKSDFWTKVEVADDLTARVISFYLTSEHPLLGFFDPFLFIRDLVSQQERFCSRFLFNALMHVGCVSFKQV